MIRLVHVPTNAPYGLPEAKEDPFYEMDLLIERAGCDLSPDWRFQMTRQERYGLDLFALKDPARQVFALCDLDKIDSVYRKVKIELTD